MPDDWRLPNIRELQTLVTFGVSDPAVHAAFDKACILRCNTSERLDHVERRVAGAAPGGFAAGGARLSRDVGEERARLIDGLGFEFVNVTLESARRIAGAYQRWGKGQDPAALNFSTRSHTRPADVKSVSIFIGAPCRPLATARADLLDSLGSIPMSPSFRPLAVCVAVAFAALGPFRSAEAGLEFGAPSLLSNAEQNSDGAPVLATDGAGAWVAGWGSNDTLGGTTGADYDIVFRRSLDDGVTWSPIQPLNTNAATDTGFDYFEGIVTDGSVHWLALWWSQDSPDLGHGVDRDIFVSLSSDAGATWSPRVMLNTNGSSDTTDDDSVRIATDGAGHWVAVWKSYNTLGGTIGTDADLLVSRSTNHGATWTAPAALNGNAAVDATYDFSPLVETDGLGNWIAVWTSNNSLGGAAGPDDELFYARSTDNGATWTFPMTLNTNAPSDSASDRIGSLDTDGQGRWLMVWTSADSLGGTKGTDHDVLVARSTDDGATWSAPALVNDFGTTDSRDDLGAKLTHDAGGHWVVSWNSDASLGTLGTDWDVLYAVSSDGGLSWSSAQPLNTSASTDSGSDATTWITTDDSGNWMAVWNSDDPLGGLAGDIRPDVFLALGHLCGDGFVARVEGCDGSECCSATCIAEPGGTSCSSDGNPCTDDECTMFGQCGHISNTKPCDDGLYCNGTDTCSGGSCTAHAGDPCAGGTECASSCNESTDSCAAPAGTACSDDGSVCTLDVCDSAGVCTHPAGNAGALCRLDAGQCDVAEHCDGTSSACPADEYEPELTPCDDELVCTTPDRCTAGSCLGNSTLCGDGVVQAACGEHCDDGASQGNGCCSAICRFEAAGSSCAGDGIACTDDACDAAGTCGIGNDSLCDDGNACTDDRCELGEGCVSVARAIDIEQCHLAPNTKLQVRYSSEPGRSRVSWRWSKGEGFDQVDLGMPTIDTIYTLCVYDMFDAGPTLAASLDVAASDSAWTNKDPKGFAYRDRDGSSDGVSKLQLKTGIDGRTSAKLMASGELGLAAPAGPAYFHQDPKVVAQLVNSVGVCWSSEFTSDDVTRHDDSTFKAATK